jgi:uncharacterized protein (TIGR02300 family)
VSKAEWGTKRLCQSCGTKFYDFRRSPALCPKCGVEFKLKVQSKPQRVRAAPSPVKDVAKVDAKAVAAPSPAKVDAKAVAATAVIDKDDKQATDDELAASAPAKDEDDVLDDTSELGKDENDMAEVVIDEGDDDT